VNVNRNIKDLDTSEGEQEYWGSWYKWMWTGILRILIQVKVNRNIKDLDTSECEQEY